MILGDQVIQISCCENIDKILIAKSIFKVNGKKVVVKMSAIFKFPHLIVKNPVLDFWEMIIGTERTLSLDLQNPSKIPVHFEITRSKLDKFEDKSVGCQMVSWTLYPLQESSVAFKYKPFVSEFRTLITFEVSWMLNMSSEVEFTGLATRLCGWFSANTLNFENVRKDTSQDLEFILYNSVPREIQFELKLSSSVFVFNKNQGRISGWVMWDWFAGSRQRKKDSFMNKGFFLSRTWI